MVNLVSIKHLNQKQVTHQAFLSYKRKIPDVFAWLNVYGTQIDYPVLQSGDNEKYLNTDVLGELQNGLVRSLWIIAIKKIFPISTRLSMGIIWRSLPCLVIWISLKIRNFLRNTPLGISIFKAKDHGVKFFAFLNVDAFDAQIYQTPVTGRENSQRYLDAVKEKSQSYRELNVRPEDRLVPARHVQQTLRTDGMCWLV